MKRFLILLAIATSVLFVPGGMVCAASFINGSFEQSTTYPEAIVNFVGLPPGNTAINGWTVLSTNLDYIGTLWVAEDGARSLDLNGNDVGGIAQTFDTVAGHRYQVSFYLAGNPAGLPTVKTIEVAATDNAAMDYFFDVTGHSFASMGWTQEFYHFSASGSSVTLSFTSLSTTPSGANAYYGPALDNVSVTDLGISTTAVPEPTTMLLFGSGLLGLWGSRKKLKK